MRRAWLLLLAITGLLSPVCTANILTNGGFETGDLAGTLPPWWGPDMADKYPMRRAPGWIEADPKTVKGWLGESPIPSQVFKADTPMYVLDMGYHPTGERRVRRAMLARDIAPKDGYSFGWTFSGQNAHGPKWVFQTVRVSPGRYTMSASWDVLVLNQSSSEKQRTAGILAVNVDGQIGRPFTDSAVFSRAVWNEDSKGRWISQSVKDEVIETKTGTMEVRLLCVEKTADIAADEFSCVAFDNLSFELTSIK